MNASIHKCTELKTRQQLLTKQLNGDAGIKHRYLSLFLLSGRQRWYSERGLFSVRLIYITVLISTCSTLI